MPDIDFGKISESLNEKMDRDAHNIQSPSAVVIAKQDPTEENGYTWYRLYSDGWVEQGGEFSNSTDGSTIVNLPVEMANTHYCILTTTQMATSTGTSTNLGASRASGSFDANGLTTTSVSIQKQGTQPLVKWQVSGKSKQN